jgi:voltage-gated potassium channel Kch
VVVVTVILIGGRFLLPRAFRIIGGAKTPELFTTLALLIVAGTAFLATIAGLSPSLGAFMAGVLLSESEYRHELQVDIQPFEGLLLGFFFISVGMSADLSLARTQPALLAEATTVLLFTKAAIAFVLARISRQNTTNALRFALALPQASEFSFVLFSAAVTARALGAGDAAFATLVTAASMVATPILFAVAEAIQSRRKVALATDYDTIDAAPAPVIICGFGRFGQVIGRVLRMHGIAFTALERNPGQVEVVRRFGNKVYFGDPTRLDMLRAAGAETAKLIVIALDDPPGVVRTVEMVKRNFPDLAILARARNRWYAHLLMDRDVDGLVRETFYSSLQLAQQALTLLGIGEAAAERAVTLFRDHDEKTLLETHAFYRDEQQLIQSEQEASEELASLFEADRPE